MYLSRRESFPVAAFLPELKQHHALSETAFLASGYGYLITLTKCDLGGHLDYVDKNPVKKRFQTLKVRIHRFPTRKTGG